MPFYAVTVYNTATKRYSVTRHDYSDMLIVLKRIQNEILSGEVILISIAKDY